MPDCHPNDQVVLSQRLARLKSRLKAPVGSRVRMEIGHQGFNAVEALELALAGFPHGRESLIVGDQGLKGQRLITGNTGQHEPEGI
jgi:2-methylcitrate dehydratase PrpD